jgi:uncharacterized protein Veg
MEAIEMMKQADVSKVRKEVIRHIGKRVKIRSNKGRHKSDITEGIIYETYPSIFLVKIDDNGNDSVKTMSFSYADVLTKEVQMMLCS